MELPKQVTSLELSKRLKELGVKQESLFYWYHMPHQADDTLWLSYGKKKDIETGRRIYVNISAFTVAELGEILKKYLEDDNGEPVPDQFSVSRASTLWDVNYYAKLLIYLLENNLLTLT